MKKIVNKFAERVKAEIHQGELYYYMRTGENEWTEVDLEKAAFLFCMDSDVSLSVSSLVLI